MATTYDPRLLAYHKSLIRAYAAKKGLTVSLLEHNAYTGLWMMHVKRETRTIFIHEARVLDVIRALREVA